MRHDHPGNDRQELNLPAGSRQVADSFDRVAGDYDRHAQVQRQAATILASRIMHQAPPQGVTRALEIGCGTGLLTQELVQAYRATDWTITDIAPRMVDRCRARIQDIESAEAAPQAEIGSRTGRGERDFHVMDAHALTVGGPLEVICSNLAFQWFADLGRVVGSLVELLAPGGVLVFNTLGAESFAHWRALDGAIGGPPTAPLFLAREALAAQLSAGCRHLEGAAVEIATHCETLHARHPSFVDFLRALRSIGAGTRLGGPPVTRVQLRNLIRQSRPGGTANGTAGVSMNYELITCIVRRKGG